ncbi:hypothetical protein [Azospirillum palustre]
MGGAASPVRAATAAPQAHASRRQAAGRPCPPTEGKDDSPVTLSRSRRWGLDPARLPREETSFACTSGPAPRHAGPGYRSCTRLS